MPWRETAPLEIHAGVLRPGLRATTVLAAIKVTPAVELMPVNDFQLGRLHN